MEKRVKEIADNFGHSVFAGPVEIASFVKAEHLQVIKGYNLILMPGYTTEDLDKIERVTKIRTVKGPKEIGNLEVVLENLDSIELSKTTAACEQLETQVRSRALSRVQKVNSADVKAELLKKPGNFSIGSLATGIDFPMRVVAEIVGADKRTDEEVLKLAKYYIDQGADIIDIGISKESPTKVKDLINILRSLKVPLSIDTMEYENIKAAIASKIDLIISLDESLIKSLPATDIPVVVVPGRKRFNDYHEKLKAIKENVELAKKKSFTHVIADPILEPINYGLSDSICAYRELNQRFEAPMLMGVGNVTELTDADSIGINAVLAGMAMECGVSLLFTTEASNKTRRSVKELKRASYIMFLAKQGKTTPKDLGLDLLVYKEKRRTSNIPSIKTKTISAKRGSPSKDSRGDFQITVDNKIIATHFKDGKADTAIIGDNSRDICDTILRMALVTELSHALYLGRELQKAEIALKTGRSYVQDAPMLEPHD
jgi:dihydropteroate synthase-like protein